MALLAIWLGAETPSALGNGLLCLVFQNNVFRSFPYPSSWLEEDDDPVVAKVNQRMQQITGLTVKTAELLQVGTFVSSDFILVKLAAGKGGLVLMQV